MAGINENYRYKLQYVCDDKTVTHEFSADIGADALADNIRDFLCGCSWSENVLKDVLNLED